MSHNERLLAHMRAERGKLEALVDSLAGRLHEDVGDGWRVRDVLAHLALWERVATRKITGAALPDGEDLVTREPWDLDTFNETMRARWRSRSHTEVLDEFSAAHQALLAAVERADEPACAPSGSAYQAIEVDGAGHYQHHLPALRALLDRQDATR